MNTAIYQPIPLNFVTTDREAVMASITTIANEFFAAWKHQALPDFSEYSFRPTAWKHEVLEDFPAFLINLLGVVEIRYSHLGQSRHFVGLPMTSSLPPVRRNTNIQASLRTIWGIPAYMRMSFD
jgi:hypothetical protein